MSAREQIEQMAKAKEDEIVQWYCSTRRTPRAYKVANPNVIHWRDHDGARVRVWRGDWSGDQFEIMRVQEFDIMKSRMEDLGFTFKFYGDNED